MSPKGRKVSGEASKARKAAPKVRGGRVTFDKDNAHAYNVRHMGHIVGGLYPCLTIHRAWNVELFGDFGWTHGRFATLGIAREQIAEQLEGPVGKPTPSPSGQRRSGSVSQKKKASTP